MDRLRQRYLLEDYCLAPDAQLLTRSGQPIQLRKQAFQVLTYLIENRDRFVSRNELLDLFWEGKDVYDDALRKCIGAIRKALNDQGDKPRFVETRWGVGYRYVGPLQEQMVHEETARVEIEKTRGVRIVVDEEEIQDETALVNRPALATSLSLWSALKRRPKTMALAFMLLAIAISAVWFVNSRQTHRRLSAATQPQPAPIHSVAVLPLKNLSDADRHLAEGLLGRRR